MQIVGTNTNSFPLIIPIIIIRRYLFDAVKGSLPVSILWRKLDAINRKTFSKEWKTIFRQPLRDSKCPCSVCIILHWPSSTRSDIFISSHTYLMLLVLQNTRCVFISPNNFWSWRSRIDNYDSFCFALDSLTIMYRFIKRTLWTQESHTKSVALWNQFFSNANVVKELKMSNHRHVKRCSEISELDCIPVIKLSICVSKMYHCLASNRDQDVAGFARFETLILLLSYLVCDYLETITSLRCTPCVECSVRFENDLTLFLGGVRRYYCRFGVFREVTFFGNFFVITPHRISEKSNF